MLEPQSEIGTCWFLYQSFNTSTRMGGQQVGSAIAACLCTGPRVLANHRGGHAESVPVRGAEAGRTNVGDSQRQAMPPRVTRRVLAVVWLRQYCFRDVILRSDSSCHCIPIHPAKTTQFPPGAIHPVRRESLGETRERPIWCKLAYSGECWPLL